VIVCLDSEVPAGKAADLVTACVVVRSRTVGDPRVSPRSAALRGSGPRPLVRDLTSGTTIWSDRAMACSITDREPGSAARHDERADSSSTASLEGGFVSTDEPCHGAAPPRVIFRTPT